MTRAEFISVIALLVSVASVCFSVYFNFRDRAHLKTKSVYYDDPDEYGSPVIKFDVVNAGRRPIVLRMWGGTEEGDKWTGTMLGTDGAGLRLAEHEVFEKRLHAADLEELTPDSEVSFRDLWVEDSLGRRHSIKDAKGTYPNFCV